MPTGVDQRRTFAAAAAANVCRPCAPVVITSRAPLHQFLHPTDQLVGETKDFGVLHSGAPRSDVNLYIGRDRAHGCLTQGLHFAAATAAPCAPSCVPAGVRRGLIMSRVPLRQLIYPAAQVVGEIKDPGVPYSGEPQRRLRFAVRATCRGEET